MPTLHASILKYFDRRDSKNPAHTKLRSSEYQKELKSSGSFAPRTPSQRRCSIWRCGGRPASAGLPPPAPSAWPRAGARDQILPGAGKSLPRSFRLLKLERSVLHYATMTAYFKIRFLNLPRQMANHESARATSPYERRNDRGSLDEVERILI